MRTKKPIPAALHKLHGEPGRRPTVDTEPEGVGDIWAPPGWFDDQQREQWHYGAEHAPAGLLTVAITGVCADDDETFLDRDQGCIGFASQAPRLPPHQRCRTGQRAAPPLVVMHASAMSRARFEAGSPAPL